MNKNKLYNKHNVHKQDGKNKIWFIAGISIVIILVGFLLLYSPIKKAVVGKVGAEPVTEEVVLTPSTLGVSPGSEFTVDVLAIVGSAGANTISFKVNFESGIVDYVGYDKIRLDTTVVHPPCLGSCPTDSRNFRITVVAPSNFIEGSHNLVRLKFRLKIPLYGLTLSDTLIRIENPLFINVRCTIEDVCTELSRVVGTSVSTITSLSAVCTGTAPTSATLCSGDDAGLTVSTARTLVGACTAATKCEYTCTGTATYNSATNACVVAALVCTPNTWACSDTFFPGRDYSIKRKQCNAAGTAYGEDVVCPTSGTKCSAGECVCTLSTVAHGTVNSATCRITCSTGFVLNRGVCVASITGDIDSSGSINALDIIPIIHRIVSSSTLDSAEFARMNICSDVPEEEINVLDLIPIIRFITGESTTVSCT